MEERKDGRIAIRCVQDAICNRDRATGRRGRDLINAIMKLSARLNREAFETVIRSDDMFELLMKYAKPELDEAENQLLELDRMIEQYKKKEEQYKKREEQYKKENEQLKKKKEDSIRCIVEHMRRMLEGEDDIKSLIMAAFKLSEDEALSFLV